MPDVMPQIATCGALHRGTGLEPRYWLWFGAVLALALAVRLLLTPVASPMDMAPYRLDAGSNAETRRHWQ